MTNARRRFGAACRLKNALRLAAIVRLNVLTFFRCGAQRVACAAEARASSGSVATTPAADGCKQSGHREADGDAGQTARGRIELAYGSVFMSAGGGTRPT